jgi:hypothetical protein
MQGGAPPRVIIISEDQWSRAGLRAELREHGYDAIGAADIEHAERYVLPNAERGPVALVIADQDVLDERTADTLRRWRIALGVKLMLLAHVTRNAPHGDWDEVVKRPVDVGTIEGIVRRLVPLAADRVRPVDRE